MCYPRAVYVDNSLFLRRGTAPGGCASCHCHAEAFSKVMAARSGTAQAALNAAALAEKIVLKDRPNVSEERDKMLKNKIVSAYCRAGLFRQKLK